MLQQREKRERERGKRFSANLAKMSLTRRKLQPRLLALLLPLSFLRSFLLADEATAHLFNTGERPAWICFSLLVKVTHHALRRTSPGALTSQFRFACPVMNGCLFCCLSCPVCLEATYVCSAMPCVPDCWGAVWHHYLHTNPIGTFISLSGFTYPGIPIRLEAGQRM